MRGFSLIQVMVLASVSTFFMLQNVDIFDQITNNNQRALSSLDKVSLFQSVKTLLNHPRHCSVSFKDLTFKKSEVDNNNLLVSSLADLDQESILESELWFSHSDRLVRSQIRFSSNQNENVNRFGSLKIKQIALVLNNGEGSCNGDYCEGDLSDNGQLVFIFADKKGRKSFFPFDLQLNIRTNAEGQSTILNCSSYAVLENTVSYNTIAVHSQSQTVPSCPTNWESVWSGYSLALGANDNRNEAYYQDLGKSGSCMKSFSSSIVIKCKREADDCEVSSDESTYWLASQSIAAGVSDDLLRESLISRCRVCKSPKKTLVIHEQTNTIAQCPQGTRRLWSGYSFVNAALGEDSRTNQDLSSPGSCLKEFRKSPIAECKQARCAIETDHDRSSWLSRSNTTSAGSCVVCEI